MPKTTIPVKEVIQLSRQGYSDADIIKYLRSEGYSATAINSSINQAKVKLELEKTGTEEQEEPAEESNAEEGMEPSIMEQEEQPQEQEYATEGEAEAELPEAPQAEEEYAPAPGQGGQGQYQQSYPQKQYYGYEKPATTEAIEELAEEIVNEKWQEFKSKVGNISEMKSYMNSRLKQLDDRMKKLETSLDRIQITMVTQVKQYGSDIKTLGSEMQALQEVLSQILQPLISSVKELRDLSEELQGTKIKKPIDKLTNIAEKAEKIIKKKK